jgi:heptaprenyl diphosphate synthase
MLNPAGFGLTLADDSLPERLESAIAAAGHCSEPWLGSGLDPLLGRPGKRLRPALVFASAACGESPDMSHAVSCAAAVELIHLSSLVHDDLMDEADSRSGMQTLHASRGPEAAILGGDYLLASSARLAATVSSTAADVALEAYADMCLGQSRETANRYRAETTLDDYLLAVNGKTAAVMRASCRLGGMCGGMRPADVNALASFGESLGMVFQLVDDLMDVVSTEELWGKPVEHDMANGVYTVCVLAALQTPSSALRALLGPDMTREQVAEAYAYARRLGVPTAVALIDHYVRGAAAAMATLPASAARDELAELPRRYVTGVVGKRVDPRYRDLVDHVFDTAPVPVPHAAALQRVPAQALG